MNKSLRDRITDITMIALFGALCYIALMLFFIPFANMYIHFGNLIVVLAALLIGGWQGGLAGSVGMGLFDLLNGHADSAPKTFILKLLIGLAAGLTFSFFKSRKKFPSAALYTAGTVSLLISAGLLIHMIAEYHDYSGKSAVLFPIFLLIGVVCIIFGSLKNKLSHETASAVVGASAGMLVNIAGEIIWRVFEFSIAGSDFRAAVSGAVLAQGSTLINAGIAIVGGVALFTALKKPFAKITGR